MQHKDTVVVEPSTEESQPTAANEDSNSDGNTEEPPTKDTSDDGDTEEPPTKDTSDAGNTEEPPTKDTSDDGNTEEPPTKDTSDDGNTEEPPTKDTSDDGNTDENIDSTGGPTVAISKRSANSQGKPIPPVSKNTTLVPKPSQTCERGPVSFLMRVMLGVERGIIVMLGVGRRIIVCKSDVRGRKGYTCNCV